MIRLLPILFLFLTLASCNDKELTFEELQKAKWDSAGKGFYFISKENEEGVVFKTDSIKYKLKGVAINDMSGVEVSLEEVPDILRKSLSVVLAQKLPNSKSGYLRINVGEMLTPEVLTGSIYLMGDFPTLSGYDLDSTTLKEIPEITSFTFISKEEAKKRWLADGNSDWDAVLNENPLPNCIEVVLDKRDWTVESLDELKSKIRRMLIYESNVSFPEVLVRKSEGYFFFEYTRYKKP